MTGFTVQGEMDCEGGEPLALGRPRIGGVGRLSFALRDTVVLHVDTVHALSLKALRNRSG